MRRYCFLFCALLVSLSVSAQTTIDQCYRAAHDNYPLIKRYGLIEQSKNYSIRNAGKVYLPQVSVSAKATYQTDATKSPFPAFEFALPLFQYQAGIEVNQAIWDGGAARANKRGIEASAEVDKKQVGVDLYTLNDRVNNLFFGILTLDEQLALNDLLEAELKRNEATVASYVSGGIATSADLDAVRVELLDNKQRRAAIVASRDAYTAMLSALVGFRIGAIDKPVRPIFMGDTLEILRPELSLFDAQKAVSRAQKLAISAQNTPRIGAFVQGVYGDPGLDLFTLGATPYAIGGVRLSWNISSFYTSKNEKAKIDVAQRSVDNAREVFLFNTRLELEQTAADVRRIKEQMTDDDQIIALRNNIKLSAQAKVGQGTMTVSDMLREVTAENAAIKTKALREIEILSVLYNIKYKTNN